MNTYSDDDDIECIKSLGFSLQNIISEVDLLNASLLFDSSIDLDDLYKPP